MIIVFLNAQMIQLLNHRDVNNMPSLGLHLLHLTVHTVPETTESLVNTAQKHHVPGVSVGDDPTRSALDLWHHVLVTEPCPSY